MEEHQGVLPGGDGLELGSLKAYWGGTDGGQAGWDFTDETRLKIQKRWLNTIQPRANKRLGASQAARQGLASQGKDLELSIQPWRSMAMARPDRNQGRSRLDLLLGV